MDERSKSTDMFVLVASSEGAGRLMNIVLRGHSEDAVIAALVEGLRGSLKPERIERGCEALRAKLPGRAGIWVRTVEWEGAELTLRSTLGRETGVRGCAKATFAGELPTGVTYEVEIVVELETAEEALRVLEGELLRVDHDVVVSPRHRGMTEMSARVEDREFAVWIARFFS